MSRRSRRNARLVKWLVAGFGGIAILAIVVLVLLRTVFKDTADKHIARATTFAANGQLPEAVIEYRRALQIDQQRGDARLGLGDAYTRTNDTANAIREYVRAADLLPDNVDAQLKGATGLLLAGRFDEARGRAERVLAKEPGNAVAQTLRGNALAGLKDFEGAIRDYESAVSHDPSQHEAFVNLGTIQYLRGDRVEAEKAFRKAIEADPKSVQARLSLANFLWAANQPADAETTLRDTLALDPNNVDANRALATFLMATGRTTEAEPHMQTLARVANTPGGQATLAQYYVLDNRRDEARKVLGELLKRKDGESLATVRLAALDALDGQRAQGERRLHDWLALNPGDLEAQLLYGELLLQSKKRAEAEAVAKTLLEMDANSARAHMLAAAVALQSDRTEVAKQEYERVLNLDKSSVGAKLELSRIELAERDFAQSQAYAQQVLDVSPGHPAAQSLIIRNLLGQGQPARAEEQLASLQRAFPNSLNLLNLQALVAIANNDNASAHAAYSKVLASDPGNLEALSGLTTLDLLAKRRDAALARLDAAAKQVNTSVALWLTLGRGYSAAAEFDKAEASFLKAIDADAGRLQAYTLLGALYASQHRLDDALRQFEGRLQRDPQSVGTQTMIGMIHEAQGRTAEAERAYRQVLGVNPRAAVASNNLAWIYVASNRNLDEALRLAQQAADQMPNEPAVNDTLGWIYVKKEMPSRALPYLEAAVKGAPNDATFKVHLGIAYYKDGDLTKAATQSSQALALKSDVEGADEARRILSIAGFPPR